MCWSCSFLKKPHLVRRFIFRFYCTALSLIFSIYWFSVVPFWLSKLLIVFVKVKNVFYHLLLLIETSNCTVIINLSFNTLHLLFLYHSVLLIVFLHQGVWHSLLLSEHILHWSCCKYYLFLLFFLSCRLNLIEKTNNINLKREVAVTYWFQTSVSSFDLCPIWSTTTGPIAYHSLLHFN